MDKGEREGTNGRVCPALALAGAAISGLLLGAHYAPDFARDYLCRLPGNCQAIDDSGGSVFLGLPLAAYGLFFYLVVLCTALLADDARGSYHQLAVAILLPLAALAVLIDLGLFLFLVRLRLYCWLCLSTYAINAALLAALFFHARTQEISLRRAAELFRAQRQTPEGRAVSSLYLLFVLFLGFAVFSTTAIVEIKTGASRLTPAQVAGMLRDFYGLKVEAVDFPPTRLLVGAPRGRIQIHAFTDFLCPPCRRLFAIDERLCRKYGGDLGIAYYNFPMDSACNPHARQTLHPFSCLASKAVISASEADVFEPYLGALLRQPEDLVFSPDVAAKTAAGLTGAAAFGGWMAAPATRQILQRDLDLAGKLNIQATPTLFIAGRRLEGVPPEQVLDAIIQRELDGAAK